jgi:hypothetical protein
MALSTNLVAYWKFDESSGNASDSVGSRTLTNNNTATYGTGIINNGGVLNGTNQSFTRTSATLGVSNSWSVNYWVKFDVSGNVEKLLNFNAGDDKNVISLYKTSGDKFRVVIANSTATGYKDYVTTTTTFSTGVWYMLTVTYDGTTLILYINGTSQTVTKTLDQSVTMTDTSRAIDIGGGNYVDGTIDEIGYWSKVLSVSEIVELYSNGAGFQYPFTSQISFDSASSNPTGGSTGTSVTVSHTTSGSNRILWVYVNCYRGAGSGDECIGVTYNGVSMTQAKKYQPRANVCMYLFYLVAPDTGANNIIASFSASQDEIYCRSASYTGVSQTGIPDATGQSNVDPATSLSCATTTVSDNCWIVGGFYGENGNVSASTNTTMRNTASSRPIGDTNSSQTPAGSHSVACTSSSSLLAIITASFSPVVTTTYQGNMFLVF